MGEKRSKQSPRPSALPLEVAVAWYSTRKGFNCGTRQCDGLTVKIGGFHGCSLPYSRCRVSAFFDEDEEEKLLLEALDAELAQELQFQEALRASLIISSSESSPATVDEIQAARFSPIALSAENQIPPGPDPDF
ncbi:unnamed protein product [Linum tenue]|uniref:Uncharacterized protein n=1 Tax=Linum tenue TaxID=586396 RepID=A0AAV0MDM1_9ROSI|nr:unnamed protein product [Linum tenue]